MFQLLLLLKLLLCLGVLLFLKSIVVVAAAVDCRDFAGDGVAVVVKDDVEWNSVLPGEGGAVVGPRTCMSFFVLFLQKKKKLALN